MITMKKTFLGLLLLTVIIVFYLIYTEFSFSPLKENDFQKLFKGYIGKAHKYCSKDFLGIGSHSELFEIYLYNITNAKIDKGFPKINEWENKEISSEAIVGKWKNCPLDTMAMRLFKFTLTSNNLDDVKCSSSFTKDILDPNNYYSYVYFNELEQYFILYCTDKQELYYIRRKGF